MNLERVQKYYELIDRELGLESEDDLFGFESDEEDDLFGFESDEDDLFGFESDEDDLFEYGFDYGAEGLKDVGKKVWGGVKKVGSMIKNAFKKIYQFIINMIKRIKNGIGRLFKSSSPKAASTPETPKAASTPETPKATPTPETPKATPTPETPKATSVPTLEMPMSFTGDINANAEKTFRANVKKIVTLSKRLLVGNTIEDIYRQIGISDTTTKTLQKFRTVIAMLVLMTREDYNDNFKTNISSLEKLINTLVVKAKDANNVTASASVLDTAVNNVLKITDTVMNPIHNPHKVITDFNLGKKNILFRDSGEVNAFGSYMILYLQFVKRVLKALEVIAKNIKTWYGKVNDGITDNSSDKIAKALNDGFKKLAAIDSNLTKSTSMISMSLVSLTKAIAEGKKRSVSAHQYNDIM